MSRIAAPEMSSYAGAAVSIGASLTLTEWGVIAGIVTALLTFCLNAIYMYRKDRREQRLKELEEQELISRILAQGAKL